MFYDTVCMLGWLVGGAGDCHCSDDELISNYSLISWSQCTCTTRIKHKILHSHSGIILNPTSLHEITFLLHVPGVWGLQPTVSRYQQRKVFMITFSVYEI